jgi:hypothetical protein
VRERPFIPPVARETGSPFEELGETLIDPPRFPPAPAPVAPWGERPLAVTRPRPRPGPVRPASVPPPLPSKRPPPPLPSRRPPPLPPPRVDPRAAAVRRRAVEPSWGFFAAASTVSFWIGIAIGLAL